MRPCPSKLTRILSAIERDDPRTAGALAALGRNLLKQGKYAEPEAVLRRCLGNHLKRPPGPATSRDEWQAFDARSLLGGALLGQQQYAAAEPLLLAGYQGMKERAKTIPPVAQVRLPEAVDRLVALYMATKKPEEMKKWQAERAKYPKVSEAALPQKK